MRSLLICVYIEGKFGLQLLDTSADLNLKSGCSRPNILFLAKTQDNLLRNVLWNFSYNFHFYFKESFYCYEFVLRIFKVFWSSYFALLQALLWYLITTGSLDLSNFSQKQQFFISLLMSWIIHYDFLFISMAL